MESESSSETETGRKRARVCVCVCVHTWVQVLFEANAIRSGIGMPQIYVDACDLSMVVRSCARTDVSGASVPVTYVHFAASTNSCLVNRDLHVRFCQDFQMLFELRVYERYIEQELMWFRVVLALFQLFCTRGRGSWPQCRLQDGLIAFLVGGLLAWILQAPVGPAKQIVEYFS